MLELYIPIVRLEGTVDRQIHQLETITRKEQTVILILGVHHNLR